MTTKIEVPSLFEEDLKQADDGSFYTICGAGGDLEDWVTGLTELLEKEAIGKPLAWFQTTGREVNRYAGRGYLLADRDMFASDLTILMFDWQGMDMSRLAIFKIKMEDRWFDDIVANMRDRAERT